jgi:hypothetical protein
VGINESEVLLDIDTVMGMAQGANYGVFESCSNCLGHLDFAAMFNWMLSSGVTVISNSWARCETETTDVTRNSIETVLQMAAASGVSVFNASGDTGSACITLANTLSPNVYIPASAPHGTAVGGTTLQVGAGNVYQSETWWSPGCTSGSGGFGVSTFFPAPPWQAGLTGTMRSVPDVAADADPCTGIVIYQADNGGFSLPTGGTSMAAPEWAAGTALINQALGQRTGNWNAVLYGQRTSNAFHPPSGMGSDFAHVGLGAPSTWVTLPAYCSHPHPQRPQCPPTRPRRRGASWGTSTATGSWTSGTTASGGRTSGKPTAATRPTSTVTASSISATMASGASSSGRPARR